MCGTTRERGARERKVPAGNVDQEGVGDDPCNRHKKMVRRNQTMGLLPLPTLKLNARAIALRAIPAAARCGPRTSARLQGQPQNGRNDFLRTIQP